MSDYKEFLKDVIGVVEATDYESLCLWKDYTDTGKKKDVWEQGNGGYLITVGHFCKRPICIIVFVHTISGHRVLFMEPTSQLVDHKKIEQWLLDNLPESADRTNTWGDGKRYINKVNAMNFHNIFPR